MLKLALTVTDPPPGITVPTKGKSFEVKYPLTSSTYLPFAEASIVTFVYAVGGSEALGTTDPLVKAYPRMVISL